MRPCLPLFIWDTFAFARTTRRAHSHKRFIARVLREWRGLLQPPPLRPA